MSELRPTLRWGRSKLGPRRVYWVVISGGSEGDTIHGQGYEADVAAAERAALALMDRVDAEQPGHYKVSRQRKSAFAARRHKAPPGEGRNRQDSRPDRPPVREYLYTYEDPVPDEDQGRTPGWNAHPILKKSVKRVWVHPRGCPADDQGTEGESLLPLKAGEAAVVLDRQELQREGRASSRRVRHSPFYLRRDANGRRPRDLPVNDWTRQALDLLGLTWPCDSDELKATYRRRSKEVHPDVGGSPEEFRRLQDAYEHISLLV